MAIRSGRFTTASSQKIINGKPNVVYRIFNSGQGPFNVETSIQGTAVSAAVLENNSLDIEPGTEVTIVPGTEPAEGIYEIVGQSFLNVRNGRFLFEINKTSGQKLIGQVILGRLYRILNSGDSPFTLRIDEKTNSTYTIYPNQSLDFVANGKLEISTSSTTAVELEGIYSLLDPDTTVRSGRFKLKTGGTPSPTAKHRIVELKGLSSKDTVVYRVYNSGENKFKLFNNSGELTEVLKEQSFDVQVDKNDALFVQATADHEIEGIYDYLGVD